MKKTIATLCAAAIGLSTFGMAAAPVGAAPPATGIQLNGGADLVNVQDRYDRRDRRDRFERRGNAYFFNGFRGYRDHRPGWRSYRGWWFPPGAFFGFSFGDRYDRYDPPRRPGYRLSARHIAWCEANYRSYRRSDNTFQPYDGPRRQCISPYA